MSQSVAVRLATWMALLVAIAGCASPPQAPAPPPEPQPIAAGKAGSQAVVFQKTLFRIPVGTPLSVTRNRGRIVSENRWDGTLQESSAFNVAVTDEMKQLGYDVRDASDAVFTPGSTAEARFQIAAIIHGLKVDNEIQRVPGSDAIMSSTATMEVEFQLFDTVAREMVVRKHVEGHAVDQGRPGAPMPKAFLSAFRRALADPEFVAPLANGATHATVGGAFAERPLLVTRCTGASLRLPTDLPRAQDAVVVVIVGSSSGTGTVVSNDGYVLTAAHVVGTQSNALLRFKSGLELSAEVVRVDSGRDAALLKVPGQGHTCLRTDSATVGVGTEIWAIGNPVTEELARSVTRGVASGNRKIQDRTYLQTDAAVNPGNSGGPLLDSTGQLRGIVVVKLEGTGIEGLAFAIPIADAESVLGIHWK